MSHQTKHKKDLKKDQKEKVLPQKNIESDNPSPGSMSEGNLSNNRYGRIKRRTPHAKSFISGTDDDGQAE